MVIIEGYDAVDTVREQIGEVFRENPRMMYPVFKGLGVNDAEMDDFFQQTYVRANSSAGNYDPSKGSLRSWLCRVAQDEAIDVLRYQNARCRDSSGDVELRNFDGSSTGDFLYDNASQLRDENDLLQGLLDQEQVDLVNGIFGKLSPEDVQLLTMRHYDGNILRKIAEEIGTTIEGIKHALPRAEARFRKELDREGYFDFKDSFNAA